MTSVEAGLATATAALTFEWLDTLIGRTRQRPGDRLSRSFRERQAAPGRLRASERVRIDHGSVLKNVLVELLVDLPADVDLLVVASAPERIWLWSDLHLSDPSVLLGWCRPYRSVEQMNRHAALPPGMYKRNARRRRYPCLQVLLLVFDRDVSRSVQSHMHRLDTSRPAAVVSERERAIVETVRRLHGLPSTRTLAA